MKKFKLEHWHRIAVILAIYDAATIFISYFLAQKYSNIEL